MSHIYILELKNNKYYIGKTNHPDYRLEQHFNSDGAFWTKKYQPIKILEKIKSSDSFDEDKYTLEYMKRYGIDNVRGGSFSQINLLDGEKKIINKMLSSQKDKCYKCHKLGHFITDCSQSLQDDD